MKRKRRQKHPVFPKAPRGFWIRFRRRWSMPLKMLEKVISLSESLGAEAGSPRFGSMTDEYWLVMRSLHARTCLYARGVLALLTNGLVDPAWSQWRDCHESATIARFIADSPEMAPRYLEFTYVNKYKLAKELYDIRSNQAPTRAELDHLEKLADEVKQDLKRDYGRSGISNYYGWSGLGDFKDIEAEVSKGDAWNPRGEYMFSGERIHAAPNAGEPIQEESGRLVFVVGPMNSGLTGPADLTSITVSRATVALLQNAESDDKDLEKMREIQIKGRALGAIAWMVDPEISCPECGGYVQGASPPELIPEESRPDPCYCHKRHRRRADWVYRRRSTSSRERRHKRTRR